MQYISTRGNSNAVPSAQAIKNGMVPQGGLYVPETIPALDPYDMMGKDFGTLARTILGLYLTDYTAEEIDHAVHQAYETDRFDHPLVSPMRYLRDDFGVLELWHGPTAAFKDMALQIMPYLLTTAAHKVGDDKEIIILVATSGDTGKAALEGFRDVEGTRIIVFYPGEGVSSIQELQMLTTEGKNTRVVSVTGNFDDCQTMVKELFSDQELRQDLARAGLEFSSANSINWGRLLPQIIYYYWSYVQMVSQKKIVAGDQINAVVPTGNFGNILAAYYAARMGLPIHKLICASNKNNILTDFVSTGTYDLNRSFHKTMSPSMDILISSNLERFLYELSGHNALKISRWYEELGRKKLFKVDDSTRQHLRNNLYAGYADEAATLAEIRRVKDKYNYVMDTHTAVGSAVYEQYRAQTGDTTPTILASTASPFKFAESVLQALDGQPTELYGEDMLASLAKKSGMPLHRALEGLEHKPVLHDQHIQPAQVKAELRKWLGIK